jgi:hypothetical protein
MMSGQQRAGRVLKILRDRLLPAESVTFTGVTFPIARNAEGAL